MNDRKELGNKGEEMAVLFLKRIGFEIIALNWRYKKLEVDIIAYDQDVLVFVEVKVRKSTNSGYPSDILSYQKQERLTRAAEAFLLESGHNGQIRFDAIIYINNKLNYIKDAFWNY